MRIKAIALGFILTAMAGSASAQLATCPKTGDDNNPLCPYHFIADPTAVEYEGRLYVYGTNDQQEFDITHGTSNNTYSRIKQLVCISSADLTNWTFHGTIDVGSICPWIATSWAPSIVSREESDGKTHFYMYFTNTASGIGVITATSPVGPWTDPIGHALIDGGTPGRGTMSNIIDPGALVDEDGTGWLTFGGGDPNREGSSLIPGNARIVKLGSNMVSLSGSIKKIPAPFHFEANELNKVGDNYVFSYSTNWADHVNDWNNYSGRGSYPTPTTCSIIQMTTTTPLDEDSWKYDGEIAKNPGAYGYPWGNNHTHMQEYAGKYYFIYHTQWLEQALGVSGGYRSLAINSINVNPSSGKIPAATYNDAGADQIMDRVPNAYEVCQAECMAQGAGFTLENNRGGNTHLIPTEGAWTLVRNMRFDSDETPKSFTARVSGKGSIKVTINRRGGKALVTVPFDTNRLEDVVVDLSDIEKANTLAGTTRDVYIIFTEADNARIDYWHFNKESAEEVLAIETAKESKQMPEQIYNLSGQKLTAPAKGINIINGKKVFVQ